MGTTMTRPDPQRDSKRRAAQYRTSPDETGRDDAPARPQLSAEQQIEAAIRRGDFDDLPLAGKPLPHLGTAYDPSWWIKRLIEREQISGVLPPALALRREDAELDTVLDTTGSEERAREILDDFNRRVVEARRQLQGGPPVITRLREVEPEIQAWRERRRVRAAARAAEEPPPRPRRRWGRRRG